MIPSKMFFTSGVGVHKDHLTSFEMALREAQIEKYNLVTVSSILPPNCEIIDREAGLKLLSPGEVVYVVLSRNFANEPHRLVGAAVGCAVPTDRSHYGYLSEYHSFGEDETIMGDYAEDLAATMLATTLGVEFSPEKAYDERKQQYLMSGKIIQSFSVARTNALEVKNLWTTILAAAVFIPPTVPLKHRIT